MNYPIFKKIIFGSWFIFVIHGSGKSWEIWNHSKQVRSSQFARCFQTTSVRKRYWQPQNGWIKSTSENSNVVSLASHKKSKFFVCQIMNVCDKRIPNQPTKKIFPNRILHKSNIQIWHPLKCVKSLNREAPMDNFWQGSILLLWKLLVL